MATIGQPGEGCTGGFNGSLGAGSVLTAEAEAFLAEWLDPCPFVTAHTSGSTGQPKEIRLPKADMLHSALATNRRFSITSGSLLVCPLSPAYVAGKMMLVRALQAGCRIVFETPSNRPLVCDYGATIDLLPVVPSQCAALLDNPLARRVATVIVGGGAVSPETEQALCRAPFRAFATYGMTETCSHVALRAPGETLYRAMPGVTFGTDRRDCLRVVAPGYTFGSLQTNDVVSLASPTEFRWLGRYDNVVISGGVKLHPESLEQALRPLLSRPFYLSGRPDPKWGQRLVMHVLAPLSCEERNQILALCRSVLPPFALPKEIIPDAEFAYTPNGKLIRRP